MSVSWDDELASSSRSIGSGEDDMALGAEERLGSGGSTCTRDEESEEEVDMIKSGFHRAVHGWGWRIGPGAGAFAIRQGR